MNNIVTMVLCIVCCSSNEFQANGFLFPLLYGQLSLLTIQLQIFKGQKFHEKAKFRDFTLWAVIFLIM